MLFLPHWRVLTPFLQQITLRLWDGYYEQMYADDEKELYSVCEHAGMDLNVITDNERHNSSTVEQFQISPTVLRRIQVDREVHCIDFLLHADFRVTELVYHKSSWLLSNVSKPACMNSGFLDKIGEQSCRRCRQCTELKLEPISAGGRH